MILSVLMMIAVLVAVAFIEFPGLRKQDQKRDLWIFSVFFLLAAVLSLLTSAGVEIASPLSWVVVIYKPIFDFF